MYSFYSLLNFYIPIILLLTRYDIYNHQYASVDDHIQDGYPVEYQPNSSALSALKDLT